MGAVEIALIIIVIILVVLLGYLFYEFFKVKKNLKILTQGVNKASLEEIIKEHISKADLNSKNIENLQKELAQFKQFSHKDIQKFAFKRYNPFHETGGNQSFTVALLNHENTGILISSLHQRDLTRVYGKLIENGNCEQKLSKEEDDVLNEAMRRE